MQTNRSVFGRPGLMRMFDQVAAGKERRVRSGDGQGDAEERSLPHRQHLQARRIGSRARSLGVEGDVTA